MVSHVFGIITMYTVMELHYCEGSKFETAHRTVGGFVRLAFIESVPPGLVEKIGRLLRVKFLVNPFSGSYMHDVSTCMT